MNPSYPKRLIEVDLPIKRISAHARREKSIRHGHISTLHIWWARRPLAACRAVILAALWPDPADKDCPEAFRQAARERMLRWARNCAGKASSESFQRLVRVQKDERVLGDATELRHSLLDFIADFANWDNSTDPDYLETSRALVQAAHESLGGAPDTRPLVVDPFAGGGAIPLEALRVGADAFASDLNPVAVLLNKVVLEYIPKYGQRLADEVRKWGQWVKDEAEKELAQFYPKDPDGATPIAYLWARTIKCEGPGCGAEVPLIRSVLLARRRSSSVVLDIVVDKATKTIGFRVVERTPTSTAGTVRKGSATCPVCSYTTPNARARAQLATRRGGVSDARLIAVVTSRPPEQGRYYRAPTAADEAIATRAQQILLGLNRSRGSGPLSLVPNELVPTERPSPNARGLSAVTRMGVRTFGDLFTARQLLAITTIARLVGEAAAILGVEEAELAKAVHTALALGLDRVVDRCSTLCRWDPTPTASGIINTFSRQALPIMWDFAEGTPFEGRSGGWLSALEWIALVIERETPSLVREGDVKQASATAQALPDDAAQALVTDPPYYDAIPYADLSDFFYVWLKRSLFGEQVPDILTPKDEEAIWNPSRVHTPTGRPKDESFYEAQMTRALLDGRRVTAPNGVAVVVFAHKSTAGWEAILAALVDSGWITTASWPIDTEMGTRMNAMGTASLASSIHLVCHPREDPDGSLQTASVGDWREVLAELPTRIHDWMPRLAAEGVVGADAIFACLGPALEVFSRHSRVEKASGEVVKLKEYLEHVWAAVAREALSMIFAGAETSGLEEDARLTAMWLWTLSTAGNGKVEPAAEDSAVEDDEEGDADTAAGGNGKKGKMAGYVLEYDAARKIAQGLGAHLEDLKTTVEVKGETARLLPVAERTRHLFGRADAEAPSAKRKRKDRQMKLGFAAELDEAEEVGGWGEKGVPPSGQTVLDRVHQSMILFAAGRGEALRRFLVDEGAGRDQRFWRLAQALAALYPAGSDERRWVEGVQARKKGLGL